MVAMTSSSATLRRRLLHLPAIAGIVLGTVLISHSQDVPMLPSDDYTPRLKKRKIPDLLPTVPTLTPAVSIPVGPLGYAPPGLTYLGRNNALISLDFLDENRLLFTFRAPGLLHREASDASSDRVRQMRAVVLTLPDGKVQAQTVWLVPDPRRYLWMLRDGRFLLREHDGLSLGDDKLETKPFLQIPGELVWLEVDPAQKVVVANSIEKTERQEAGRPATSGSAAGQGQRASEPAVVVRVVELASGRVIQTQHPLTAAQPSIDAEGSLETVHDKLDQWSLRLNPFLGGSRVLGHVESTCLPNSWFISDKEILVAGCNPAHGRKLDAISTAGQQLWETETAFSYIQPRLFLSTDGSRFARETIVLKNGGKPPADTLWVKAVKGQAVRVFDAANGKVEMETPVSPTLDGGGNVAFSPSGRRLAVLNAGSIEVFDLPPLRH
jgi:hypothetical protein